MPTWTVAQIAELCKGTAEGDLSREIRAVTSLEQAGPSDLSFVNNRKAAATARESQAGCLLVPHSFDNADRRTAIRVDDPRVAMAAVVGALHSTNVPAAGVHPAACIALTAVVPPDCYVGPNVVIGENTRLASGCSVHAGSVIGSGVTIGEGSIIHPNVTIYPRVEIGRRVILHSGCVIGADGFGFAFDRDHYEKFPQIGTVRIEDDVEIGANSCVDRAALGTTRIGKGTKIDNGVHIAHNCDIGCHVVIAAQTGFSGAVKVGDYAVIGGQVGVGDKATIESKAVVGSGSGILTSKIVHAGEPVWGTPARPLREHLQQLAAVGKTPAALKELKELKARVAALEKLMEIGV